jgi:hypothetical protein
MFGQLGSDWKRFIEGYSPDQWATFTFPMNTSPIQAKRKLEQFFIRQSRRTKQHIFMPYGSDEQPLRGSSTSDCHTHFHCFLCYEREPIPPKQLELLWGMDASSIDKKSGTLKKAVALVEEYHRSKNGVAYTFLKHREHQFPFFCPRNKDRCNRKDRVCYFAKDPYHWKQIKHTHTTETKQTRCFYRSERNIVSA